MALTQVPSTMIDRSLATIASATTTDLSTTTSENVSVTGTTTITSFGTLPAGALRYVTFAGILTLTHNATSLILPGAANITTAAGDVATLLSLSSGNWRCISYTKANGQAVVAPAGGVTSITAGGGLTGGTITTTGTIAVDTSTWAIGQQVLGRPANRSDYAVGATVAGSALYATDAYTWWNGNFYQLLSTTSATATLVNTGTWKCLSPLTNHRCYSCGTVGYVGLWVRIS